MEEKFDYHIFGIPAPPDINEGMGDKIIDGICFFLKEKKVIQSYFMDDLREISYEIEELIDAVKKTIRQIDKGIYCVAYSPPSRYGRTYDKDVLFILWTGKVKNIFGVQSFKGIIVDEYDVSIFSSCMISYGTVYGRINLNRSTFEYIVEKSEFFEDFRWDYRDKKTYKVIN